MFVEKNVPRFTGWLDKVANGIPKVDKEGNTLRDNAGSVIYLIKPDPLGALKIVGDLTEYHLPKLVRQDVQRDRHGRPSGRHRVDAGRSREAATGRPEAHGLGALPVRHAARRDRCGVEVEVEQVEPLPSWLEPT